MSWLGLFPHLERFICWDWSLPWPVSDVFLTGLLDIFTAPIGNCFASLLWSKACCWWTISICRLLVTAFSRVRSPSNYSRCDNLLSWMPVTSIPLAISLRKSPKPQCLAKAYTSLTKDATGSLSSCLLHKKLTWSKSMFLFYTKLVQIYLLLFHTTSIRHQTAWKILEYPPLSPQLNI